MAKYRVLKESFIDNKIVQPGDEIEFSGKAGKNLEAMKEPRKPAGENAPGLA